MKVALVTGAARRVGAEIAKTLHQHDYHVVMHCHQSGGEAQRLATSLNQQRSHSACVLEYDLAQHENLSIVIEKTLACWGQLDLLVNNASNFFPTPVGKVTLNAWQSLMAVNLQAPFFLSQAAYPWLQKTEGNIINIADIHADFPMRDYSAYCIAKSGLVMATKALAKEMAPSVRVNAIAPGTMMWPEGENALSIAEQEKLIQKICLKRQGTAQDIAEAVFFLSQAAYITGQVLAVDGGRSVA